jgi:hypothetical protein
VRFVATPNARFIVAGDAIKALSSNEMAPGYQDSPGTTNITRNASLLCHNLKSGPRLLLTNGTTEINEVTYQMRQPQHAG